MLKKIINDNNIHLKKIINNINLKKSLMITSN